MKLPRYAQGGYTEGGHFPRPIWTWGDAFAVALLALMCALAGYAIASLQLLAAALYLIFAEIGAVWLAVTHSRRRNRRAR